MRSNQNPGIKTPGGLQSVIHLPTQPHERLEITGPKKGELRVRDVVRRSNARPTVKYPSMKMGRMLQAESAGEHAAFVLFDTDPSVKAIHEQPLSILYWLDDLLHKHIPDVLVERFDQRLSSLYEVKECGDARSPEVVARTRVLAEKLPAYGFSYQILISEDLLKHPNLRTAELLLLHGRSAHVDDLAREQVRAILEARGTISWAHPERNALGADSRAILCRLTLEGVLDFDRAKPLSEAQFFLTAPRKA